jgi:hypothetical protein
MRLGYQCMALGLAAVVGSSCGPPAPDGELVSCPNPVAGCHFELGGELVTLRFLQPPRAMQPFTLEVDAPAAVAVAAEFSMLGMDMLPNRHQLVRAPDGRWRASIVLPVCVSGRTDWRLALTVNEKRASVPFYARM